MNGPAMTAFASFAKKFGKITRAGELNGCCLEFAGSDSANVRNLRGMIGKRVYNKELDGYMELIIE